jgi:L-amino acid N-acyltransferase YncA
MKPIRLATPEDAAAIAAIYAPNVTDTVISFEYAPPDAAEMRRRLEKVLAQFPWLVWEEQGVVGGYVYASAHKERAAYQWSADVSAYVHGDFRRRGVARALYETLFQILRVQGYQNAYAGITLPNAASVGLHEAVGFTPVGVYRHVGFKMGRWHDVGWWELSLGALVPDPPAPRPFPDVYRLIMAPPFSLLQDACRGHQVLHQ